jgi:hypothetical protein
MVSNTGMEYTDGLMEEYITESSNRVRKMAKDITGGPLDKNIGESTRMTCDGERESDKGMKYYYKSNTKKISLSPGVKYSELI